MNRKNSNRARLVNLWTRLSACFVVVGLSLSFIRPAIAESQSVPEAPAAEVKELAAALVGAASGDEQERLLESRKQLMNRALLDALKAISDPIYEKSDYPRALKICQLTVRIAERIGDKIGLGHALLDIGVIHARQLRIAQALESLQKSLALFEAAGYKKGIAGALLNIGIAYVLDQRFEEALPLYEQSLAISEERGDRKMIAAIYLRQGFAHASLGRYELGMDLYNKCRALSEELGDKTILDTALNNIATHYITHGRYAEALDFLLRSLRIKEETGSSDPRSLAIRLLNIGLVFRRQGQYEHALGYAQRSLKIMEGIGDKFAIANLQNNIGVVYKAQGHYDLALEWLQKSFKGYQELKIEAGIARSLNNIGDAYRQKGLFDRALEPLMTSLALREKNYDRGGVCLTLNNLARLYQQQGKYAEMLEVSRRSAAIAEEINSADELWNAQEAMGTALLALGQSEDARQSFLKAIATIESIRHEVAGGGQQQQSFLENKLSPWMGLIALLVSRGDDLEALSVAEQSKARVLLDTLQGGHDSLQKSLSDRERQDDEQKRLRLVSLNSQLGAERSREKPDSARVAELKEKIDKARLDFEAFETGLYVAHPELRTKRGEAPIIKTDELAALVPDPASALLEYVVANNETYLFAITKANVRSKAEVRLYRLPIGRAGLAKQIEVFRQQVASRDLAFRASAAALYELLLKPAREQLKGKTQLIIVPDDRLWDLPFQTVLTRPNRFLIEDAAVAYAPSLTALREMNRRRKDAGSGSTTLLALGNPRLGSASLKRAALTLRDERLGPLPEAEQEVKALRQLYGASRSRVYVGEEAREERVKIEASQARILHFATHGMLNNAAPMYSYLALAEGGAKEDGLLEAWELMQLELKADLAVLSACDTARGRIGAGEGIIGLSWAMFIAGVPSIVVSQWKVETAGTRDLMVNFHRLLISPPGAGRTRPTKAEALRASALKLMKNPATSHPFYWAGFVLVGDGR
jgi:CHAT domain-containing protein